MSRLAALSQVEAFRLLSPEHLARLARLAQRRVFPSGSILMRQGDVSASMHVIVRGRVAVERSHPALSEPLRLAELGPGEVVGEMGVLDDEPRSATVIALEDTETLELSGSALAVTLLQSPEASMALLRMLSRRLRSTDELAVSLLRKELQRQQERRTPETKKRYAPDTWPDAPTAEPSGGPGDHEPPKGALPPTESS